MVKPHAHHTFKHKYLFDYKVLKIPNDTILLLTTPNEKERKANIDDDNPCSTTDHKENTWDF